MERVKELNFGARAGIALFTAFLAVALSACGDTTSTAGVISETESGQTASITVTLTRPGVYVDLPSGEKPDTRVALMRSIDGRTTVVNSATPDSNSRVTFKDIPLKGFSIVASTKYSDGSTSLAGIITDKLLIQNKTLSDTGLTADSIDLELQATATLRLDAGFAELSFGDSVCITGTLSCGTYDEAARDSGFIVIRDIPATTPDAQYVDYDQVEILGEGSVRNDSVSWRVHPGETREATRDIVIETATWFNFSLPETDLMDSLSEKSIDSLLVPVTRSQEFNMSVGMPLGSRYGYAFLDEESNMLPWISTSAHSDSATLWVTLPRLEDSLQVIYVEGEINPEKAPAESRIRNYFTKTDSATLFSGKVFSDDSSFALSFWIEKNASEDSDLVLVSSVEDSIGFEIRQCLDEKNSLCTRIYNGIDTLTTDSIEYGKANILDGSRHHFTMAIHKKHLAIAIDGITIRDTDLKLSENFYKLEEIQFGKTVLEGAIFYSFGDFVRKPEDKDWARLKAWLYTFYELQK